jgi:hypothetical protein
MGRGGWFITLVPLGIVVAPFAIYRLPSPGLERKLHPQEDIVINFLFLIGFTQPRRHSEQ